MWANLGVQKNWDKNKSFISVSIYVKLGFRSWYMSNKTWFPPVPNQLISWTKFIYLACSTYCDISHVQLYRLHCSAGLYEFDFIKRMFTCSCFLSFYLGLISWKRSKYIFTTTMFNIRPKKISLSILALCKALFPVRSNKIWGTRKDEV